MQMDNQRLNQMNRQEVIAKIGKERWKEFHRV